MENTSESTITPMGYLKIFFRRKEVLIISSILGLVIGACVGIVLPKKYVSSTVLLVEEGKSDNPLFSQLAVSTTMKQRIATIKESMLGWNSLVELVQRIKLDQDVRTPKELEKLILQIRDDITIKLKGDNIINLSYEGEDPEQTQAVVKNITEIFIERNLNTQNKETADAIAFIEQQLKVYRGKIKSAEIAKLRDNLKTLLADSTEEHPRVKELREAITMKEEELKKENLEYTDNVVLDSTTANPIISEIKKALDNLEGGSSVSLGEGTDKDYYKVMLIDKLDNVMARDVGVNTNIYNVLLQRLETAKITQRLQASKEGTRYTVLDPPRIPLKPEKPNKLLIMVMGFFGGAVFGIGLIFGFEFLDQSFIDVEETKNFLDMPLLGAISKINTEFNIRRDRERKQWLYSLTCVAGIVIILLTATINNLLK